MSEQPKTQPMRERLTKLFEFLKAYIDLRFPPVRNIEQQPRFLWLKDLPSHPSVELLRDSGKSEEVTADSEIVLRLKRPVVTQCPPPPAMLAEWLKPIWRDLPGAVEVQQTRNVIGKDGRTSIERFDADSRRPASLRAWQRQRDQWADNERPARQSLALFQTVYEWYGVQEREGERMELLVATVCCAAPMSARHFAIPSSFKSWNWSSILKSDSPSLCLENESSRPSFTWNFCVPFPG